MAEKFHTDLKTLKKETVEMAHFARGMLSSATDALIRQDKEQALAIVAKKEALHDMEVKLEEHCYQLIATGQPMAKDMRVIVCTLKVINASMRIGRYGKVIANIVKDVPYKPHITHMMSIPHMAELVMDMIDDAIKAYETDSVTLVAGFSARDDTIDALRHSIFREGITYMMEDPKTISLCTHYIMVARYLERCADHACKIAENVHYMHTGERIEIH
jgi:phosphate transport system protein